MQGGNAVCSPWCYLPSCTAAMHQLLTPQKWRKLNTIAAPSAVAAVPWRAGYSLKRGLIEGSRRFHNHGEGPY